MYLLVCSLLMFLLIAPPMVSSVSATVPPAFLFEWGSAGTGPGEFQSLNDVAIGAAGRVYVCEAEPSERVQVFDALGTYLFEWGGSGTAPGQFVTPTAIDCDGDGNVYVVQSRGDRVQKFDADGNFILLWNLSTASAYRGLAVDPSGIVYVSNPGQHRVEKYSLTGTYLGDLPGSFMSPEFVECDPGGNVYVGFGTFVRKFDSSGAVVMDIGTWGSGPGEFYNVHGIAADSFGNVFVSDEGLDRVQKFDAAGGFLCMWGSNGSGEGEFDYPRGLDVGASGTIYVVDKSAQRVQAFGEQPVGVELTTWGKIKTLRRP